MSQPLDRMNITSGASAMQWCIYSGKRFQFKMLPHIQSLVWRLRQYSTEKHPINFSSTQSGKITNLKNCFCYRLVNSILGGITKVNFSQILINITPIIQFIFNVFPAKSSGLSIQ